MAFNENNPHIFIRNKSFTKDDIKEFILRWNVTYPIDRWWREKHNVAFNSPEHRVVSFLDMYIEWCEDQFYKETIDKEMKNREYKRGDWLNEQKEVRSIEDDIRDFESMDLSKLDDK